MPTIPVQPVEPIENTGLSVSVGSATYTVECASAVLLPATVTIDGELTVKQGVGGVAANMTGSLQLDGAAQISGVLQASSATITGNLQVNGDHHCAGTMYAKLDVVLGSDCAEDFDVSTMSEVDPGTVMVLDEDGALRPGEQGYDKKVAGVISGAGEYQPGLILGRSESPHRRLPLALVGRVYCKVDAGYGPVEIGDLLTTSPTPGHAMRAGDPVRAFGAVIGKALRGLNEGQGLIPILVALQ
jgi:hypothetical protein